MTSIDPMTIITHTWYVDKAGALVVMQVVKRVPGIWLIIVTLRVNLGFYSFIKHELFNIQDHKNILVKSFCSFMQSMYKSTVDECSLQDLLQGCVHVHRSSAEDRVVGYLTVNAMYVVEHS